MNNQSHHRLLHPDAPSEYHNHQRICACKAYGTVCVPPVSPGGTEFRPLPAPDYACDITCCHPCRSLLSRMISTGDESSLTNPTGGWLQLTLQPFRPSRAWSLCLIVSPCGWIYLKTWKLLNCPVTFVNRY